MSPGKSIVVVAFCLLALAGRTEAQEKLALNRYHSPEEVGALLKGMAEAHPGLATLEEIGKSGGGNPIFVMRIAAEGDVAPEKRPGVLVCANLEGRHLIGTETALALAEKILNGGAGDKAAQAALRGRTIYVAPLLNPDAAGGFFAKPRWERTTTGKPVDEDLDEQADEDGPDDLNGDGMITMMRVKDPEGEYIADPKEPRLMRKAEALKGERGVYKLYVEGIDNDGDGEYNEDPAGGVELNRNLPQDFENNAIGAGRWPVSQPETIALAKFMTSHPAIAMVLSFSTENTLVAAMAGGGGRPEGEAQGQREGRRRSSPATAVDAEDKAIFEAIQKEYKDALKAARIEYPEKKARAAGKGSLVSYCYFQYGVPVFSNDVWALPEAKKDAPEELTLEKLKGMNKEQFLKLEDRRIEELLRKRGVKAAFVVKDLKAKVERGQNTPATLVELLEKEIRPVRPGRAATPEGPEHPETDAIKFSDTVLGGKGFVPWRAFQHPTLGEVEIGGFVPYVKTIPPPDQIEKPARFAADFYLKLMPRLGGLAFKPAKVEALDENLYGVTCYLTNPGRLPTSTAQGRQAQTAWPITVRLKMSEGQTLFSGRPIETVDALGAAGGTEKIEWTVRGPKGSKVTITADSPRLGAIATTVTLEGKGEGK